MKKMTFTDTFIKKLKPTEKKYSKSEGNGFTVRVMPSGVKTWLYAYEFDGRKKEKNLGQYPEISLADARDKFEADRKLLKNGTDPGEVERLKKEEKLKAPTVSDLCDEYIKKHAKKVKKSWEEDQRALEVEIVPQWGKRKAADIKKRDVVLLLEGIVERGSPVMANRVRALISKMFNFAVERDIVEMNPCSGVKPLSKENPKERHLSEVEIKTLFNCLDTSSELIMTDDFKRILKLILVTAQRPGEVTGMHSREIDGKWWTIPAERSKNGKAHRVYLTGLALELIGKKKGFIFESPKADNDGNPKPIDEKGLARALRRNIKGETYRQDKVKRRKGKEYVRGAYKEKKLPENPNRIGVDFFTPHDLRRTAATFMAESGVLEEIVDRVLNHSRRGVTWTYNRYPYEKEIQAALESWERKLNSITKGKIAGNVVDIATVKVKARR